MDIIMHICILSFINFNKHYIVHLYNWSDSLFILLVTHLSGVSGHFKREEIGIEDNTFQLVD